MSVLSHQTLVGTMTKMVADAGIFLQHQKGLITKSQAIQQHQSHSRNLRTYG